MAAHDRSDLRPAGQRSAGASASAVAQAADYVAFGLKVRSDVPLPELLPARFEEPDVRIRVIPAVPEFPPPDALWTYSFEPGLARMLWPPVGRVTIRDGHDVELEPAPGVEPRLLPFPLLGPVMSYLLFLRGNLVLHGSAVSLDGEAVVFLGDKRAGKSTMAATFVAAGHPLLTDDVVAMDLADQGRLTILPAFPQLKLSEEASGAVRMGNSVRLPLVMPGFEKRQHRLNGGFEKRPVPVRGFYLLRRGGASSLRELAPVDAVKALMRFSHLVNRGDALFTQELKARHMQQCAAAARLAPVSQLTVPSQIGDLPSVIPLLAEHIRADRIAGA